LIELGLQFFAGLESDRLARWNVGNLAGAWIAPDAALAGLNDENSKPSQFNPLAALQSVLHSFKQRLDRYFRFDLWNSSLVCNLIYYV